MQRFDLSTEGIISLQTYNICASAFYSGFLGSQNEYEIHQVLFRYASLALERVFNFFFGAGVE